MLGTIEPNKQFQVRPKNKYDRERLIIAIWANGYMYREMAGSVSDSQFFNRSGKRNWYKTTGKPFPYFGFFLNNAVSTDDEKRLIVCPFSRKYAKDKIAEYPIVSVDWAIEWLHINHGPRYIEPVEKESSYVPAKDYDPLGAH
jgi:hypothetical protein